MKAAVSKSTAEISVEKNVRMPPARPGKACPYPFAEMVKGDSFFVPTDSQRKEINCIGRFKARFQQEHPHVVCEFECRRVDGGVRCWRTK